MACRPWCEACKTIGMSSLSWMVGRSNLLAGLELGRGCPTLKTSPNGLRAKACRPLLPFVSLLTSVSFLSFDDAEEKSKPLIFLFFVSPSPSTTANFSVHSTSLSFLFLEHCTVGLAVWPHSSLAQSSVSLPGRSRPMDSRAIFWSSWSVIPEDHDREDGR